MISVSHILEKLKRDGFYVVENVIPEDEVDAVRQAISDSTGAKTRGV